MCHMTYFVSERFVCERSFLLSLCFNHTDKEQVQRVASSNPRGQNVPLWNLSMLVKPCVASATLSTSVSIAVPTLCSNSPTRHPHLRRPPLTGPPPEPPGCAPPWLG
jgi:hypothetical protein